jgi:hypothetical protein
MGIEDEGVSHLLRLTYFSDHYVNAKHTVILPTEDDFLATIRCNFGAIALFVNSRKCLAMKNRNESDLVLYDRAMAGSSLYGVCLARHENRIFSTLFPTLDTYKA